MRKHAHTQYNNTHGDASTLVAGTITMILKVVKNTHRHPINQALHFIGAPFYAIGLCMVIGHFVGGMQTNLLAGFAIWISAVAMFIVGHKVEGNIMTITPILLARLLSRKVIVNYFAGKRIHLLRTWLWSVLKH